MKVVGRAAGLIAAIAVLAWSSWVEAEPMRASLSVTRQPGAETCADERELTELVEAVAGAKILSGAEERPVHLQVVMARSQAGFEAKVELSGARSGVRTIEGDGPGCEPLGQALAVTIAVLLDAGSIEAVHISKPVEKRKRRPAAAPPAEGSNEKGSTSPVPPLTLGAGGFYDFGTLGTSSGGLLVSIETIIPIVSFGLSFLGLPYSPSDRFNSDVVYRFLGGRARVCTRQPYLELFGASLCLGFLAGQRRGEDTSEEEEPKDGAFLAAVIQAEVSRRIVGPFGLYADLALSIPFYKDPIEVGTAVLPEQPVTFQMGAGVRFWIGK